MPVAWTARPRSALAVVLVGARAGAVAGSAAESSPAAPHPATSAAVTRSRTGAADLVRRRARGAAGRVGEPGMGAEHSQRRAAHEPPVDGAIAVVVMVGVAVLDQDPLVVKGHVPPLDRVAAGGADLR